MYRDERFSPRSVEKDRAILEAVGERLRRMGHAVSYVRESELEEVEADVCLSMARSERAIGILRNSGIPTINTPEGVALCCHRSALDQLMRREHIAMPPLQGNDGYWLKRGDSPAETKADVVFCANAEELAEAQRQMAGRGIGDQVVSAHVKGDLLKFYGVSGTSFFRYYYPADDGISKFGDEERNGVAHHYAFDVEGLRSEANRLAALTHTQVYGGDCIVGTDGRFALIDFNDWPSFSRCRDEAAQAVAQLIIEN